MVPKSEHLANPRFDKKPSAQANYASGSESDSIDKKLKEVM